MPTTNFSATPLIGSSPLTVTFTDLSSPVPSSWLWDFGDGNTSTDQNPTHVYATAGSYSVTLTPNLPFTPYTQINYITATGTGSYLIKSQSGNIKLLSTDPEIDAIVDIQGSLNVSNRVAVGDETITESLISTTASSTGLLIKTDSGDIKLQPNGRIMLGDVFWPSGAVTPTTGMYLGVSSTNDLEFYNLPSSLITLTGDVTGSGVGSVATTLATVNISPQTDAFRKITVNPKGLVTATSAVTSSDIIGSLGYTPYNATNPSGYTSNTGTVTSVNASGGTTGLSFTGGAITTSGTLTLGGTLAIANGGTGATTASSAINALLPTQIGNNGMFLTTNGTDVSWAFNPTGSVSSVSVTTANGISGTVTNPTTTPAITLSLGAITPTSVVATGNVTGANLSGTNTGDQTITLTGDVTGSGTGSFVTTLATVNSLPQTDTFRKITVNTKGLITDTSPVDSTDITTALGFTPIDVAGSTMTGPLILNADPSAALGAATKQYVDNVAAGLHAHLSCVTATTETLALSSGGTISYNNGISGVGATLTTTGSFSSIGGQTTSDGDRILVKDETTQANNGIYVRTSSTVLTRATDFDNSPNGEIGAGDFTYIQAGTLAGTQWVQTTTGPITMGTTSIVFTQLSGSGTVTAGTGITVTGNSVSLSTGNTLSLFNLTTNGLVTRTDTDTITSRTITGTSGNINVSNGDGVLGNPTIDLATLTNNGTGSFLKLSRDIYGRVAGTTEVLLSDITTVLGYTPYNATNPDGYTSNTGTVTSVSIVTANGISGTVTNPTTTPAITLSLGAITPTSVVATGNVTGANLSGTNTGDQTITLTGDVTGSGTGSFSTTLSNTGVSAGSYTNATITVNSAGRITAASNGTAPSNSLTINNQTGNYTLQLSDASNVFVRMTNSSSAVVTIPSDTTANLPVGSAILIGWSGTGAVSVAGEAGVTVNTPETLNIRKRYGKITAIKVSANTWEIEGNLAPVL